MPARTSRLPAALAAAATAVAASNASAQRAAEPRAAAPAVRPVATYRFAGPRDADLPTHVTVADSAGALVASYRIAGDPAARPLTVAVLDTDLVLQGAAPAGLLTLRLEGQNDAAADGRAAPFAGRWWLGERQGALREGASRRGPAGALASR